jgi:predicted cupin superfamily sugar epimerase
MHATAEQLIERLDLQPHPEGGLYREVFRSRSAVELARGARAALTAIHFLLPAGSFSAFHRVESDEAWCHLGGDPLELAILNADGGLTTQRLGRDLERGEIPLAVVPGGAWQAAAPLGARFAWCACLVAPGFDFADFELPARADLTARFPQHRELIQRFTRPTP